MAPAPGLDPLFTSLAGIFSPRRDALGGACPTAPNGYVRNVQLKKLSVPIRKVRDQLNAL